MAGRLTKNGKAFYLFTMPGHPFPDSPVLTNSAWSYLRHTDFLMAKAHCWQHAYSDHRYSNQVIGVCCGRPSDPSFDSVPKSAANAVESAREAMRFSKTDLKHRRANTPAGAIGVSYGGGQAVSPYRGLDLPLLTGDDLRFQGLWSTMVSTHSPSHPFSATVILFTLWASHPVSLSPSALKPQTQQSNKARHGIHLL